MSLQPVHPATGMGNAVRRAITIITALVASAVAIWQLGAMAYYHLNTPEVEIDHGRIINGVSRAQIETLMRLNQRLDLLDDRLNRMEDTVTQTGADVTGLETREEALGRLERLVEDSQTMQSQLPAPEAK